MANQQSSCLNHLKQILRENEYLVICDFAENYSFILQDAAQGFHWNNTQTTLHPFSIYTHDSVANKLKHRPTSFVVISDCLVHDTVA